ncbi:MAG: relaxase/mobilization nuclease domain-containing protein, partial [Cyclobacteriaceae bacterium]|nr:relaxase/mobilization nuclease domain-containing protein [Cyclobacteriaceae bacterium]
RKNELGKSQLLKAENFGALGHSGDEQSKLDYINYMRLVCDSNPRVKNRQFHAVISAKGNSHSSQELTKIAEQYLKFMGYGDNPYLIYFHADTKNNHVHMVSTRVDKNGNKVDDTFEKIRSQKVLQEILNQDPHMEAKTALENALTFNFSTKAQFKFLLEEQGFKFTEKNGQLNLIKYGILKGHSECQKLT